MPSTTTTRLIKEATAAFIPCYSKHVPRHWTANVDIRRFRVEDEVDMVLLQSFADWMTQRYEDVLAPFKAFSDFILHRVILAGYEFNHRLDQLVPEENLSKATKLNKALLSKDRSIQEEFHQMLKSRGEKYGFTLGEVKNLIYVSTRREYEEDDDRFITPPAPFMPELCSGSRGGFKDEESLYTLLTSLQWCNERFTGTRQCLMDCSYWKSMYMGTPKNLPTVVAVEQFRPVLRKLLNFYTEISKSIDDGNFSP